MQFNLDGATIGIATNAPLRISDGEGRSLRVLSGRVWITQEGSLDDLFLDAGQSCRLESTGAILVSAENRKEGSALVSFDAPLSVRSKGALVEQMKAWVRRFAGESLIATTF